MEKAVLPFLLKLRTTVKAAVQKLGEKGNEVLLPQESKKLWGILLGFLQEDPDPDLIWARGRAVAGLLLGSGKAPELSGVFLTFWERVAAPFLYLKEEGKYPQAPSAESAALQRGKQVLANALWAAARKALGGKGWTPSVLPPLSSVEDVGASLLLVLEGDGKKPSEVKSDLLEKVAEGVFAIHRDGKLPLPRREKRKREKA